MFKNKIFITIDIDWACDEVISNTLNILQKEDIKATFLVTHETKLLERLRKNKDIEIGIHPNFNSMLFDKKNDENVEEKIDYLKLIVPEAVTMRSHSLTQNSYILQIEKQKGITYDLNTYIPFHSNIETKPFYNHNEIIRVPFGWEDDLHCIEIRNGYRNGWNVDELLEFNGVKIFNFHPIHIFLNTEDLDRYERAKPYYKNYEKLKKFVNNNEKCGTRFFLNNLISKAKEKDFEFLNIKDIKLLKKLTNKDNVTL